jgi:DNA-binding GntR family transcriptional regulator
VFPTVAGWPEQSERDHRRIIDALAARDPEAARAAMADHFTVGVAPLTEHLVERGVIDG